MEEKDNSKILLDKKDSKEKEEILDCTKEIEDYINKIMEE